MKSVACILIGLALVCRILEMHCSVVYTFMNETGSSRTFWPWMAAQNGRIKLSFKAFDSDGLIFYVGDNNDPSEAESYMYLKIEWGVAVLVTQVHYYAQGNEENWVEKRSSLGRKLDNGKLHKIDIERRGSQMIFTVDGKSSTLELEGPTSSFRIASNLYLGGIPQRYLYQMCDETMERFPRFLGCIEDLSYGERAAVSEPIMTDAEYADPFARCQDACDSGNMCQNGGKCRRFKCDCFGTRYKGQFCDKPTPKVSFHQLGYIEWKSEKSSHSTDIALSFKTNAQNGFLFGTGNTTSYIVVEMVNKTIRVGAKLKTGSKDFIIIQRLSQTEDGWHFLRITRRKQEVRVAIDGRQEQSKVLIANDDDTAILDNAYLGGEWTMGKTFPDFTKEKFAGDFTEAYYNGVDLIQCGKYKNGARRPKMLMEKACKK